jgi:hypothetical protein
MNFGLFLFLDPIQWIVLISSLIGASICGYLYFTNRLHRIKMGFLFGYNLYIIARYALLIYFRQDSSVLSSAEISILNLLGQVSLIYMAWIIVYLALDARYQSKLLTKRGSK